MVYRVRVIDKATDKELRSYWVGDEELLDFIQQTLTKDNKIIIVNDYYDE